MAEVWHQHLYLVACKTTVKWKQRCDAGVSQVAASAAAVAESAAGVTVQPKAAAITIAVTSSPAKQVCIAPDMN